MILVVINIYETLRTTENSGGKCKKSNKKSLTREDKRERMEQTVPERDRE